MNFYLIFSSIWSKNDVHMLRDGHAGGRDVLPSPVHFIFLTLYSAISILTLAWYFFLPFSIRSVRVAAEHIGQYFWFMPVGLYAPPQRTHVLISSSFIYDRPPLKICYSIFRLFSRDTENGNIFERFFHVTENYFWFLWTFVFQMKLELVRID